jgi:hypothetical protein
VTVIGAFVQARAAHRIGNAESEGSVPAPNNRSCTNRLRFSARYFSIASSWRTPPLPSRAREGRQELPRC